jgi:hypothetical protein
MRTTTTPIQDGFDPRRGELLGRAARTARAVVQASQAAAAKMRKPFVSGFAADPETAAEGLKGLTTCQHQFDQLLARPDERNNFPRHDRR